ncbi:quinolinate synthase [Thermosulfuriphilus ammonigenes]|nr:quinolinate synthase NadA [Thermosulfuriphilus ammonigenes]MBA2848272.1 quinolinate synthase [Thermosulfuriphilus ammonigenes]
MEMDKERLKEEIRRLAEERRAIILAHNYQPPEIQDLADLTGDSLELSLKASQTEAEVIVFCGVHFMAETASIVSPDKTVLLPRLDAGCRMADMLTADQLRAEKAKRPGVPVVTYVNSTAECKAETDICCTSANAVKVVGSLEAEEVYMTPDKNLAMYTQRFYPDKRISYWHGYCPVHEALTKEKVLEAKARYPRALFMAHPECRPEVIDLADAVRSTSGMLRFAQESDAEEFIVGTEVGLLYPLSKVAPGKRFYPAWEGMICPNMKRIGLKDLYLALKENQYVIKVPEEIRQKAWQAVSRMLALK